MGKNASFDFSLNISIYIEKSKLAFFDVHYLNGVLVFYADYNLRGCMFAVCLLRPNFSGEKKWHFFHTANFATQYAFCVIS